MSNSLADFAAVMALPWGATMLGLVPIASLEGLEERGERGRRR